MVSFKASLCAFALALTISAFSEPRPWQIDSSAKSRSFAACDESAAVQYLRLIEAMNWEAMHQKLAENARYLDLTMAHYDRPAIDLAGPDAIVSFWRTSSKESGTSDIRYHYTHCFETAGFYVIRYEIEVEVSGQFWGLEQERLIVPGQVVSIIQMVDGLVSEHRDYVDYAGADRYIDDLRERDDD